MPSEPASLTFFAAPKETLSGESAQKFCIIFTMVVAYVLQSAADAFWGMHLGLIVTFAIAFLMAWVASQSKHYSLVYALPAIAICCILLSWCIISPLPGEEIYGLPGTDRLNYYILYYSPNVFHNEEYEFGFLLAISIFRNIFDFTFFLLVCAALTLFGYLNIISSFKKSNYFPLLLCLSIGYFAFWSGALNITRQFMAGGLLMISASLLLPDRENSLRTHAICLVIGVFSISIHSSAAIIILFQILLFVKKFDRIMILIWIVNFIFFAANFFEISPLRSITSRTSSLSRYDIEQASSADLVDIINVGVGNGNRLDWALFLVMPILLYVIFRKRNNRANNGQSDLGVLALFYTTLTVPFYSMSYLIYADRLAYYAYLMVPPFILIVAATPAMRSYRTLIVMVMAVIAISQFAIGWYGYTPLYWSGALLWGR